MSSDIESTLEFLVLNDYASIVIVTAIVYDYALTFAREIETIWCRPWTWVSTMFVVVRYIGLCWMIANALNGTSFITALTVRTVTYQISIWAFIVFLSVADWLMLLRVYAMWNQSKIVLSILLLLLVVQTITTVVLDGIYNVNPKNYSVTIIQVLNSSFCSVSHTTITPAQVYIRFIFSATLIVLAVWQTLKQSFEMYKATKQWQPNRYMQKLVGDGILYFVVNVSFQVIDLSPTIANPTNAAVLFLITLTFILFYILMPRFIIGIRELYDHDIRGSFHIDTGLGVRSRSNVDTNTTVSAMVFVDGSRGVEVEGGTGNSGDLEQGGAHGSVSIGDSE